MPKDTFLNLPEEKRRLIEAAAVAEFAARGFDKASINRIVAECQIAKGSFYQYFQDKQDLFRHLLAQVGAAKVAYISPVLMNPEGHDFFTLLSELYRSGLAFAKESPELAAIGHLVYKNRERAFFKDLFAESQGSGAAFYRNLLEAAIAKGEVRPDINRGLIIHLLISLNVALFEYYFETVKSSHIHEIGVDNDIMETVTMTLDFVENGLSTKGEQQAAPHLATAQAA